MGERNEKQAGRDFTVIPRQVGAPWSDCLDCRASFSPAADVCPNCGSERLKQENPDQEDLFILKEKEAESRLMATAIFGGSRLS